MATVSRPGWFRTQLMKRWYTLISQSDVDDVLHFMNYGYSDDSRPPDTEHSEQQERYPLQLYHLVASQAELRGKDLLEVGCGRGGGLAYVSSTSGTGSSLGVDLNPLAIDFCRRTCPGITFQVMDAQDLQLPSDGFDVVLNVESSHRYPDFGRFLQEVFRVLRPGGVFLFADFRWTPDADRLPGDLERVGFEVVHSRDITGGVRTALRADAERRERLVKRYLPWPLRRAGLEFAGTPGTRLYRSLESGARTYVCLAAAKPATAP